MDTVMVMIGVVIGVKDDEGQEKTWRAASLGRFYDGSASYCSAGRGGGGATRMCA